MWTIVSTIFCIVIPIVWATAGVNAPTWYNATHYYVNSSRNSSRLKNRRCELTFNAEGLIRLTLKLECSLSLQHITTYLELISHFNTKISWDPQCARSRKIKIVEGIRFHFLTIMAKWYIYDIPQINCFRFSHQQMSFNLRKFMLHPKKKLFPKLKNKEN